MNDAEIINNARRTVENAKSYDDYNLAVLMVRDLETTKAAELSDAAWDICANYGGKNDALWLVEKLEEYVEKERDHV